MQFDYKTIEEKLKQLPEEIQTALTSVEISQSIKNIGNHYELKLDQEEVLYDLVAYAMLGLSPSKDFVKNFSNQTGIDTSKATLIAQDINKEVFGKIKASMQAFQQKQADNNIPENLPTEESTNQNAVSPLEQAGNFTVEPAMDAKSHGMEHIESKNDLIKGIENPTAIGTNTDLLVDHLLSSPVVIMEKKTEQVQPAASTKPATPPQAPKKPSGPDLYREPVE